MGALPLTPAQALAIASTDRSAAITAGAGSGKTHVLIERIAHLLTVDRLTLDQLCCITFTEKSAAELKARLLGRLPVEQYAAVAQAQISTFHALQSRILREQSATLGCDPRFTILEEQAAALLLARQCRETLLAALQRQDADAVRLVDAYSFAAVVEGIETLVDDRWHFLHGGPDPALPAALPAEAAIMAGIRQLAGQVIGAYQDAKQRARQYDFADLEIESLRLLTEHADIRAAYQERFRAILVDEAQDLNDAQVALLRQLFAPGTNTLTIVGDPKQSIYRFRGANVAAFRSLTETIAAGGGQQMALQENFRNRAAICAFVNRVAATMPGYAPLQATREDTEAPAVAMLAIAPPASPTADARRGAEAEAIAADLCTRHAAGQSWGDCALLFQAKRDMERYAAALRAMRIPCVLHSGGAFFDRPEVLDLLAALEVTAGLQEGRPPLAALLRVLRSPLIGLTDDACYRLVFPNADPHGLARGDLPSEHGEREGGTQQALPVGGATRAPVEDATAAPRPLSTAALADPAVGPLLRGWLDTAQHLDLAGLVEQVVRSTGYEAACLANDPGGQSLANIEKLYWIAREEPIGLADFLAHIGDLRRRAQRTPDQPILAAGNDLVQLMTVHAAKGLEFDLVYLPDLFRQVRADTGAWLWVPGHGLGCTLPDPDDPFAPSVASPRWEALAAAEQEAHAAERMRLLYVAMTRTREQLILPIHEGLTRDTGTWHAILKQYCSEVPRFRGSEVQRLLPSFPATQNIGTSEHRNIGTSEHKNIGTVFTVSQLDTFAKCPMQYRLQYVDRIPASIFPSPHPSPTGGEGEIALTGALLGDILHTAIRKLSERPGVDPQATLLATCRQRGCTPSTPDLVNANRLLATYCAVTNDERISGSAAPGATSSASGRRTTRLVEWPFALPFDGITIRGTIDALIHADAGWEIVDYKTDRIECADDLAELQREYTLQMGIYAMAATAAGIGPIRSTQLVFLDNGRTMRQEVTPAWLATIGRQLGTILQRIAAEGFAITPTLQPPCARCPYHHNGTCWEDQLRPRPYPA